MHICLFFRPVSHPTASGILTEKGKKKNYVLMHCWLKLSGQPSEMYSLSTPARPPASTEMGDPNQSNKGASQEG